MVGVFSCEREGWFSAIVYGLGQKSTEDQERERGGEGDGKKLRERERERMGAKSLLN